MGHLVMMEKRLFFSQQVFTRTMGKEFAVSNGDKGAGVMTQNSFMFTRGMLMFVSFVLSLTLVFSWRYICRTSEVGIINFTGSPGDDVSQAG